MNLFYDNLVVNNKKFQSFRIPALIQSEDNILLAFCEGRRWSSNDNGQVVIIQKKSIDNGETWSDPSIIYDIDATFGNPCPVYDKNGRLHLFATWNHKDDEEDDIIDGNSNDVRRPYHMYSDDDGISWSVPNRLDHLRKDEWRWYATGPGNGICLRNGRLIIPCNHTGYDRIHHSHIIYSDNDGETWHLGAIQKGGTNESAIVELKNGNIMHNMRLQNDLHRGIAISDNGGDTFDKYFFDNNLVCAICQGSTICFNDLLLFSCPQQPNRTELLINYSIDDGKTWDKKLIFSGSCGYSSLVQINDNTIGLLYERDDYRKIAFRKLFYNHLFNPIELTTQWKINDDNIDDKTNRYLEDMYLHRVNNEEIYLEYQNKNWKIRFDKMIIILLNQDWIPYEDINRVCHLNIERIL